MQRPPTQGELYRRRREREIREREVRRRRLHALRIALVIMVVVLIALKAIDPDFVVAGGAIWTCIPGE